MIRTRMKCSMISVGSILTLRLLYAHLTYSLSDPDSEYLEYDEDSVDTDMLPTMLVYHDGELVYNWVRVDWEAGGAGVEELLVK